MCRSVPPGICASEQKWRLILLEIVILMATWVLWFVIGGWAVPVGIAVVVGVALLTRSRRTDGAP